MMKARVVIVPLGDFNPIVFSQQLEAAAKVYEWEPTIRTEGPSLLQEHYVAKRRQYGASRVLLMLRESIVEQGKVMGVTSADLFVPSLNFVFGLADMKRGVCLLSTARLTAPSIEGEPSRGLVDERFFKEATHELGHLFGLTHCLEPTCIMSFANSIYDVDRKLPMLCPDCLSRTRR